MAEADFEPVSELPPAMARDLWAMNAALDRWLHARETSHLKPIDRRKVLVRPHSPQEQQERLQRLRERQAEGKRPPSFKILRGHRRAPNGARKEAA